MRLRWRFESPGNAGILILESPPQFRTILLESGVWHHARVPLPNMLFVVRYEFRGGKHYCDCCYCESRRRSVAITHPKKLNRASKLEYPGLHGVGLRVYGTKKPISSFQDVAHWLPTDLNGSVCTNHDLDCCVYEDVGDIVKLVTDFWFSAKHRVSCDLPKWKCAPLGTIVPISSWHETEQITSLTVEDIITKQGRWNFDELDAIQHCPLIDEEWPNRT
jgi:hypothetical protein